MDDGGRIDNTWIIGRQAFSPFLNVSLIYNEPYWLVARFLFYSWFHILILKFIVFIGFVTSNLKVALGCMFGYVLHIGAPIWLIALEGIEH